MKTRILPPAEADLADAVEFYISEGGFDAGGGWLRRFGATHHAFWPDDLDLVASGGLRWTSILGPRQITGTYLLALAVHHGGRFVTFDRAAPLEAVAGATASHLVVL